MNIYSSKVPAYTHTINMPPYPAPIVRAVIIGFRVWGLCRQTRVERESQGQLLVPAPQKLARNRPPPAAPCGLRSVFGVWGFRVFSGLGF